jgi:antitoxin HicB
MLETKTLAYYVNLKYPMEIVEDDDAYVVSIPDLPGCVAYGDTVAQAIESLRTVKKLWFEGRLEAGLSIPEPIELDEYSGKFVLRITRALHKALQRESQRQGVSLNQYIGQILAERHRLVDLEYTVRDTLTKCLSRPESSLGGLWATTRVQEISVLNLGRVEAVSTFSEQFTETFAALVGEKQRKSYELILGGEPANKLYWISDAPKKTKTHAHHG